MNEEKFADSGEFQGHGVPGDESGGPENAAENGGEARDGENAAAPAETGGGKDSAANGEPGEASPDPLDLPIEDFAKVDLGLGDAPVDKVVLESFGKTCADLKLTPRQAAGLGQFQLQAIAETRDRLGKETAQALQKAWGKDAVDNQRKIISLVGRVDEKTGGKFSQAIEESGIAIYADFAEGLLQIAAMLGENGLGAVNRPGASARPETAEEGLREVFAKRR